MPKNVRKRISGIKRRQKPGQELGRHERKLLIKERRLQSKSSKHQIEKQLSWQTKMRVSWQDWRCLNNSSIIRHLNLIAHVSLVEHNKENHDGFLESTQTDAA